MAIIPPVERQLHLKIRARPEQQVRKLRLAAEVIGQPRVIAAVCRPVRFDRILRRKPRQIFVACTGDNVGRRKNFLIFHEFSELGVHPHRLENPCRGVIFAHHSEKFLKVRKADIHRTADLPGHMLRRQRRIPAAHAQPLPGGVRYLHRRAVGFHRCAEIRGKFRRRQVRHAVYQLCRLWLIQKLPAEIHRKIADFRLLRRRVFPRGRHFPRRGRYLISAGLALEIQHALLRLYLGEKFAIYAPHARRNAREQH